MSIIPFNSAAPPTGAVAFDTTKFRAQYREFATVGDAPLSLYFDFATMKLSNSKSSIVKNADTREKLLYLLVAHIATLMGRPGQVGRVKDATEGTVEVKFEWSTHVSEAQAYYDQTQYGVLFWSLTKSLRTFRYIPGRSRG